MGGEKFSFAFSTILCKSQLIFKLLASQYGYRKYIFEY